MTCCAYNTSNKFAVIPPCLPLCSELNIKNDEVLYGYTDAAIHRSFLIDLGNKEPKRHYIRNKKKLKPQSSSRTIKIGYDRKTGRK